MPIYVHQCKKGHKFDVFKPLSEYDNPDRCHCGEISHRITVPTMIAPDMQESYISPTTGKVISSYRQRREDMARSDCVDYEPSLKHHQKKRIEALDAKLDKEMGETIEKQIDAMPCDKREMLGKALETSDINLIRG